MYIGHLRAGFWIWRTPKWKTVQSLVWVWCQNACPLYRQAGCRCAFERVAEIKACNTICCHKDAAGYTHARDCQSFDSRQDFHEGDVEYMGTRIEHVKSLQLQGRVGHMPPHSRTHPGLLSHASQPGLQWTLPWTLESSVFSLSPEMRF